MNRQRGFSLIEVMIALGILSIGLLAMATLVSTTDRMLTQSDQSTRAAYLAQNKMEALRVERPFSIKGNDEVEGMRRRWSVVRRGNSRLWIVTVEVFLPGPEEPPIVLKSQILY